MIKLNKLKEKRGNRESKTNRKTAYLRIIKDINDLNLPKTCRMEFPDPDDLSHFKLTISPDEGFYRRFKIIFDFQLSSDYPYEPPKVKCETEIYHPNIDLDGNVCLNILRQDWKPVLSINSIVYGLQYLLLEPNPGDALNETAANQLKYDRTGFAINVEKVGTGFLSASLLGLRLLVLIALPRQVHLQFCRHRMTAAAMYVERHYIANMMPFSTYDWLQEYSVTGYFSYNI